MGTQVVDRKLVVLIDADNGDGAGGAAGRAASSPTPKGAGSALFHAAKAQPDLGEWRYFALLFIA